MKIPTFLVAVFMACPLPDRNRAEMGFEGAHPCAQEGGVFVRASNSSS
jgi:hypothetical protein